MNTITDNYIKQEPNTIEEEFITIIPPIPNVDPPDIPVKTESFFNEHDSLVAVKNEPTTNDGFLTATTPLKAPVSTEIPNKNNSPSTLPNSFVIHEFEPHQVNNIYLQDSSITQNVQIITAKSQAVPPIRLLNAKNKSRTTKCHPAPRRTTVPCEPLQQRSLGTMLREALASTSTYREPTLLNAKVKSKTNKQGRSERDPTNSLQKSTLVEKITTTKPPILLNTRLLKRPKFTGNTNTVTNLTNKKACYNLLDVEVAEVNRKPSGTAKNFAAENASIVKLPNTCCIGKSLASQVNERNNSKKGDKKIINYIMQKKRVDRIKTRQVNQTSTRVEQSKSILSPSINNTLTSSIFSKINLQNQQKLQGNVVKVEKLDDFEDTHKNTIIQSTTIPKEAGNSYPSSSLFIPTTPIESIPIKEESVDANMLNQLNTIQMTSIDKRLSSETPTSSKISSEIKVKCLCRLTADNNFDDKTAQKDLKDFFNKMFQETRRLNKQQQRTIKTSLLNAICEAEEMVENGKCCCF